jgi:nicotinamidase/pyrazinamidase
MTRYDDQTALVVVDMQNDFAAPNGSLSVRGGVDVVEVVNTEVAAARWAGAVRIYTQDWHPESTPHFAKDGGSWPVHCVAWSWGAAFVNGLDVDGPSVRKGTGGEDGYSGFTVRDPQDGRATPTELEQLLRDRGVERVVIVGIATDYCVKETALDAVRLGFTTVVRRDGVRAVDVASGDGDEALTAMAAAGVVIS